MDSDENSNQSAPAMEITDFKREPNEESSSEPDNITKAIYLNQQDTHGINENNLNIENSISGAKRKITEENSLNIQEDDNVSEVTNAPSVVVKRRRYSESQCDLFENPNDIPETNDFLQDEAAQYTLFVTHSPGEWTSQQIIDYIREECGLNISKIKDSREGNNDSDFQITLKFPDKNQQNRIYEKLKKKQIEGKLQVHRNDETSDEESNIEPENVEPENAEPEVFEGVEDSGEPVNENAPSIDLDQIETESEDNAFYIREDYLTSLGIKTPITSWITVTNFRCDKTELKEVLEIAGRVLICSVVMSTNRYANVMYSHPLEAVQAISMLNGQKLYGKTLKLTMNNSKDPNIILPKGLSDAGPGLGMFGKRVPDIAEQYKRFINGRKSSIDASLFQPELLQQIGIDPAEHIPSSISRSVASNNSNSNNDNDNASEQGSDVSMSESNSTRNNDNQFGVIGDRILNCTISATNATQYNNTRISNFTQMNQSIIVRSNGPVQNVRGQNLMPIPNSVQAPMHLRPPNAMSSYCPPIAGINTANTIRGTYNISVVGNSSRPTIPGPIMARNPIRNPMPNQINPIRQLGPMPMVHVSVQTTRFTGPVIRNVGPNIGQNIAPNIGPNIRPNMRPNIGPNMGPRTPTPVQSPVRPYVPSNVQMYKGADPVTIQISNLPPSTNFVNLGQKLSEFGHVVFLEFTTPGCAVVRYANPAEADRCLHGYRGVIG